MFDKVVNLYRAAGKPTLEFGIFTYYGQENKKLLELISECKEINDEFGDFQFLENKNGKITFEFKVPATGNSAFYNSFADFIQRTPTLGHGELPPNIYILDEDWSTTDGTSNENFEKIKKCCKFIKDISQVVMISDTKSSLYYINLIFAIPAEIGKPPRTFSIQTRLDERLLEADLRHAQLMSALASSEQNANKLHFDERKAILNLAISNTVNLPTLEQKDQFMHILLNWQEILDTYRKNLLTYVHGFSFDKARKDLAQAELDYGSKLSGIFGDLAGKLLALPISLTALVILKKAETPLEEAVTTAGLIMVSLIFLGILHNQKLSINRLENSLSIALDKLDTRTSTYPESLRKLLKKTTSEIQSQKTFTHRVLTFFSILSTTPTAAAIGILIYKYWDFIVKNIFHITYCL
ncbi:hypothetical protein [Pseudomonas sp. USHLN015]|uniref:hypothetical protein n=1 Tax=Pseudomonas sp. USHLN015 TaxID=3081296 RepID=UPI00301CA9D9